MAYVPQRGDIVHLEFDPASGREMKGPHFGLVLSSKTFNQLGLAWVCPISQGEAAAARSYGTIVSLIGAGTDTQGAIHCHQLKALDWKVRRVRLKERAPGAIIDDVLARVDAIINGD